MSGQSIMEIINGAKRAPGSQPSPTVKRKWVLIRLGGYSIVNLIERAKMSGFVDDAFSMFLAYIFQKDLKYHGVQKSDRLIIRLQQMPENSDTKVIEVLTGINLANYWAKQGDKFDIVIDG